MNIYEDTNPRELKELLYQIHTGETVLPDFQRDFVWDASATIELIISIAQNYPAGSLLRIRNTNNLFAYREFQGAPPINGRKPIYLILDGQQRLTSLYQAFYGVGDIRYFIHIRKLLDGKDFEDCIFYLKNKKAKVYETLDIQANELVLPLRILKNGSGEFTKWLLSVASRLASGQEQIDIQDKLIKIQTEWIQTVDEYHFPVVTLTDSTSAEAVCTIFETLNRTGVKLGPYELLTARYWHQGLNLRQLWADTKIKHPIIVDYAIEPYYVMQVISLLSKEKPSCKRAAIMELKKSDIEKWWDLAIDGLCKGLELLQQQCGVLAPGYLPYNTISVPLAAILAKINKLQGPSIGVAKDKVCQWFWCSVFGQKYESASNTQSALDFVDVVNWIDNDITPESIKKFEFDQSTLRETTGRQRAIYRGTLCLVLRQGTRDFHSNDILTLEVIRKNNIDDHHIFPDTYLEKKGIEKELRDCVLNHTLIDRETNQSINARPPSIYMTEIREEWRKERGEDKFEELLRSHLLPTGADSPFWSDNYGIFLDWRQEAVWQEIVKLTGYKTPGN